MLALLSKVTDKVKTDARVIERINAKRPPTVATEAVAVAEEDEGHVAAVATATAMATAAAAATKGSGNALSAAPRITLHVTVPNQDNRL